MSAPNVLYRLQLSSRRKGRHYGKSYQRRADQGKDVPQSTAMPSFLRTFAHQCGKQYPDQYEGECEYEQPHGAPPHGGCAFGAHQLYFYNPPHAAHSPMTLITPACDEAVGVTDTSLAMAGT